MWFHVTCVWRHNSSHLGCNVQSRKSSKCGKCCNMSWWATQIPGIASQEVSSLWGTENRHEQTQTETQTETQKRGLFFTYKRPLSFLGTFSEQKQTNYDKLNTFHCKIAWHIFNVSPVMAQLGIDQSCAHIIALSWAVEVFKGTEQLHTQYIHRYIGICIYVYT